VNLGVRARQQGEICSRRLVLENDLEHSVDFGVDRYATHQILSAAANRACEVDQDNASRFLACRMVRPESGTFQQKGIA
jgi:hypothetical protein